jgi:hypothetical protein
MWGEGKDVISANKQYAGIQEQVDLKTHAGVR